jgi:hypothetical protein
VQYTPPEEDEDVLAVEKAIRETQWSGQVGVEQEIRSASNWADLTSRWGLAVTDVSALLLFAFIGRASHVSTSLDFGMLKTAAPFVGSWLALSPFLGAYTLEATGTKGSVIPRLLPSWAVCVPVAIALRAVWKGEVPPTPFVLVSLASTLVILSVGRIGYVLLLGETTNEEYRSGGLLETFKMITTLVRRW